jgi:hypothetical protein
MSNKRPAKSAHKKKKDLKRKKRCKHFSEMKRREAA